MDPKELLGKPSMPILFGRATRARILSACQQESIVSPRSTLSFAARIPICTPSSIFTVGTGVRGHMRLPSNIVLELQ
jgi:hypothetical protein